MFILCGNCVDLYTDDGDVMVKSLKMDQMQLKSMEIIRKEFDSPNHWDSTRSTEKLIVLW